MKASIKMQPNPAFYLSVELGSDEIRHLERWMSEHTGPDAPDCYKELLVEIRKAIRPSTGEVIREELNRG